MSNHFERKRTLTHLTAALAVGFVVHLVLWFASGGTLPGLVCIVYGAALRWSGTALLMVDAGGGP